jgi:hypothetical protein
MPDEVDYALTPEQERIALGYDPWGERDATYRTLSNKFVTTRRASVCSICADVIGVGCRVRATREVDDGKAMTFRFCVACCYAMAHRYDHDPQGDDGVDPFDVLYARYDMGRKAADRARSADPQAGGTR